MSADAPCGDAAAWFGLSGDGAAPTQGLLAIVDGLGHGAEAACAAEAAVQALAAAPDADLPALMRRLDGALGSLRGAAVGLVRVQGCRLQQAGVGNTRCMRLRSGHMTRLPSQNGIVGGGLPTRISVSELDLAPGDWLLLFSDGLAESLQLPVLLPEWERDPGLLCEHLLQQAAPGRDDAGVLVMQMGGG
ncbi:SpoIIE family protein phosphatase [Rubrivivax gelatinosus]|nr:SpoIIE family protein phosphatase [Rubrivivax gelatinosus]